MSPVIVATALLFLAVTAFVAASGELREEFRRRALRARLSRTPLLGRTDAVVRDRRRSTLPWLDHLLRRLQVGERIETLVLQSGVVLRPGALVLLSAVAASAALLAGTIVTHSLSRALLWIPLGASLPWLWVLERRHHRSRAFLRGFPDALTLLTGALRAGLSFTAAMQVVSEEAPEPVRGEFAIVVEEQALGMELRESLERLCRRVESLDLRFFVTAVLLQRETGGNLAEVLSNTAALIRDRFRVLGDISTFTAQGKLTAAILVMLPLVMGTATALLAPEYFAPMLRDASGRNMLWTAAMMQCAGILVCWRIVSIRV